MGLLDQKQCSICYGNAGRLAFTFKNDKNCLCKNCTSKIPDWWKKFAKQIWCLNEYQNTYLPFLNECEERRKQFKLRAWYGPMFIDETHGFFCYSPDMELNKQKEIPVGTPIFKFTELSPESSSIYFDSYQTNEGIIGYSTKGDIVLQLCTSLELFGHHAGIRPPGLNMKEIIKHDITLRGKKKDLFVNLPEDLQKFRDLFFQLLCPDNPALWERP